MKKETSQEYSSLEKVISRKSPTYQKQSRTLEKDGPAETTKNAKSLSEVEENESSSKKEIKAEIKKSVDHEILQYFYFYSSYSEHSLGL